MIREWNSVKGLETDHRPVDSLVRSFDWYLTDKVGWGSALRALLHRHDGDRRYVSGQLEAPREYASSEEETVSTMCKSPSNRYWYIAFQWFMYWTILFFADAVVFGLSVACWAGQPIIETSFISLSRVAFAR